MKNQKLRKEKMYFYAVGIVTGIANGLFGSGGGMLCVPLLERSGIEAKKSHATSIAVTLPLSIISAAIYYFKGHIDFLFSLKFIPLGLAGALVGAFLLKRLSNKALKKIFGAVLIISGIRMFMG